MMHRTPSVDVHKFAMVPRSDIPRSRFRIQRGHKTTFDAGFLVPVMAKEVLPGDTFNCRMTAFCRLATPIFPFMDNLHLESFFFFVPNRLVWSNWEKFMGEQANPADSISFTIPQLVSPVGGYVVNSLGDMFGLPTVGQVGGGNTFTHSALPFRGYNLIFNQWFRDENLVNSIPETFGDGPDAQASYVLRRRGKRHDYFTSLLPWTQKGGVAVPLVQGGMIPVIPATPAVPPQFKGSVGGVPSAVSLRFTTAANPTAVEAAGTGVPGVGEIITWESTGLVADASVVGTINQLRLALATQSFLEKDARGGSRYTESVRHHFGVVSPDARLQRTEYLGGGSTPITLHPITQNSATGLTGGTTPIGNLSAAATALAQGHGFTQSFTEHGYIIGLVQVRADLTYQQGLQRPWSRLTRYDHYFPVFANLGEQAVLNKEIYCDGSANDALVLGYQERWGELRYDPSQICGLFRSTSASTIDPWHLAQRFTAVPTLNETFISDTSDDQLSRVLAVGAAADGKQFLFDAVFDMVAARPMPLYSVPGQMGRF